MQRPRSSIFITPHLGPSRAGRPRRLLGRHPPTDRPTPRRRGPCGVFGSIACRSRPPGPDYPPQQRQKFSAHAGEVQRVSASVAFRHSHQIGMGWQELKMQTKKFTQQALDTIADHRIADFTGNSHARARQLTGVLSLKHEKKEMLGMVTSAAFITGGKFRPAANTDMPWKAQTRHQNPRSSGAQALAPLGATTAQNSAAAGGGHTGTETVGTDSSDFTGLICSFHDSAPFSFLYVTPAVRRTNWAVGPEQERTLWAFPLSRGHMPQRKTVSTLNIKMHGRSYIHARSLSVKRNTHRALRSSDARHSGAGRCRQSSGMGRPEKGQVQPSLTQPIAKN